MKYVFALLAILAPLFAGAQSTVTTNVYPTVGAACYVPNQTIIVANGINVIAVFQCSATTNTIVQLSGPPGPAWVPSAASGGLTPTATTPPYNAVKDEVDLFDVTITGNALSSASASFTPAINEKTIAAPIGPLALLNAVYVSGITATGAANSTCTITFPTPSGGVAATGFLRLSATNTVAASRPIFIWPYYTVGSSGATRSNGSGYTTAPTTGTASNGGATDPYGAATCSGSVVLTSTLAPTTVNTTLTYVDANDATLAVQATTNGTNLRVSYGTNNLTAIQACINAGQVAGSGCYLPAGQYLIAGGALQITSPLSLTGDGSQPIYGSQAALAPSSNWSNIMPSVAPFLSGSVIVQASPLTDIIDITSGGKGYTFFKFGGRFSPAFAFFQTGHGINTQPSTTVNTNLREAGLQDSYFASVHIWGQDGQSYGFNMVNTAYVRFLQNGAYGGGGVHQYSNGNACCFGNFDDYGSYYELGVGGTASDLTIDHASTSGVLPMNLFTFLGVQWNAYAFTTGTGSGSLWLANWYVPTPDIYGQNDRHLQVDTTDIVDAGNDAENWGGSAGTLNPLAQSVQNFIRFNRHDIWAPTLGNQWYLNVAGTAVIGFVGAQSDGSFEIQTNGASTPLVLFGSKTVTSPLTGKTVYSAAGTAIPACTSTTADQVVWVSDATTHGATYASGGSIRTLAYCDGTTTTWYAF